MRKLQTGNIANFEVLGLTLNIGLNKYYDDGFVSSIKEHLRGLDYNYGHTMLLLDKINFIDKYGVCVAFRHRYTEGGVEFVSCHICYLDDGSTPENIVIRSHEETEALEEVSPRGLEVLSQKIFLEQKVRIDFNRIENKEIRAYLGSIYALEHNGFNPCDLLSKFKLDISTDDLGTITLSYYKNIPKKAWEIYRQGKISKIFLIENNLLEFER